jgi:hypothetical protein
MIIFVGYIVKKVMVCPPLLPHKKLNLLFVFLNCVTYINL